MSDAPRRPRSELPLVQLIPNFITVAALCAGLSAIRFSIYGEFSLAAGLILLAAVLDGLDGRLARLLKSESEVGAELDSFGDFVNFGVAPGFTLYLWALQDMNRFGWIATLMYIVCCLMRLVRFNMGNRATEASAPGYFTGVPSPAGAMLALLPLFLALMMPDMARLPTVLVAGWMVGVGALMIGRFPTPSFKTATIYTEYLSFSVIGFVVLVAALTTFPWMVLVGLDLAYIGLLLLGWLRRRKDPGT